MSSDGLAAGLRGAVSAVVADDDTALALGSGDVPVLGTPRLLALAEAASVAAVAPRLASGQTTVGTAVRLEHRRPSPVGTELAVQAELTSVDGRRLAFTFTARQAQQRAEGGSGRPGRDEDDGDVIGAGTIERVLVDRERFVARLQTPVVDRG
ncbi:MAG TPA: hotdog domain-containing protein [Streptosporangiaceae bacterium]